MGEGRTPSPRSTQPTPPEAPVAQPLPPLTEVLSLGNADALCHVVVDRGGMMNITATDMGRGGAVTTQRS